MQETEPTVSQTDAPKLSRSGTHGLQWWVVVILMTLVAAGLIADRVHYLVHFGFVYTDADQTIFWYQATDVAHGIFREPCVYGQAYNPPVEAWMSVPLLWCGVPAYMALPITTAVLGLLPFAVLAGFAYRSGRRLAAAIILLIPLALPVEYTAVTSMPRGFINGLAMAVPVMICWVFLRSRKGFFWGGFFAVLALTTNGNASILLLAIGVWALATHFRRGSFYLFSVLGAACAAPAPILIALFYKYHPECNAYRPSVPFTFDWELLKETLRPAGGLFRRQDDLNLFFAHFVPGNDRGWVVFVVLGALVAGLLLVKRFGAAAAIFLAGIFMTACLGIERVHMSHQDVFYPGSRMFLALPVLVALGIYWLDGGLCERIRKWRWMRVGIRGALILGLVCCVAVKKYSTLNYPSPLLDSANVPPIQDTPTLIKDSAAIAEACKKFHATLVLISGDPWNAQCMNDAGTVLTNGAFSTLYPPFERRTFLIKEEQTRKHTRVLLYLPTDTQTYWAEKRFPASTLVSETPLLLLIQTEADGRTGMDISKSLGILYRPHF